jgi:hypothetical protein
MLVDGPRVGRARQYELALQEWCVGGEWLALSHLWIAVENLTEAVLRRTKTPGSGVGNVLRLADRDAERRGGADGITAFRKRADGGRERSGRTRRRGAPAPCWLRFTTAAGAALNVANFRNRVWNPAVRAADGVPDQLRFHDLRHACQARCRLGRPGLPFRGCGLCGLKGGPACGPKRHTGQSLASSAQVNRLRIRAPPGTRTPNPRIKSPLLSLIN